jgi:hypothetical protein
MDWAAAVISIVLIFQNSTREVLMARIRELRLEIVRLKSSIETRI